MTLTIYCSGGIRKGPKDDAKLCWTDRERHEFTSGAGTEVIFLEPADPVIDVNDQIALFGRDMYQVMFADAVVVDARERRGIGIGVEMAASRLLETRLVAVVPPESHYRRSNLTYRGGTAAKYIHPHVLGLCDAIVDNFEAAGTWVVAQVSAVGTSGIHTGAIHAAIDAYRERLLPLDEPMLEARRRARRSS